MKKFEKILFPVDFSEVSAKIVPYVTSMADKFEAEVHIVFVVPQLESCQSIFVSHVSAECFKREIVLGSEIDQFAEEYFKNSKPETKILIGDVVEEIIEYIKANGIDLVIIGSRCRKGMDRIIPGSVADGVVKSAPVPVLSVNP